MDVLIKINNGSATSEMEMKGASDKSESAIIAGFFGQMTTGQDLQVAPIKMTGEPVSEGVERKLETGAVAIDFKIKEPGVSLADVNQKVKEKLDDMIEKTLRPEKSRRLPLVGQESRSSFPIEETAKIAKTDEPEHWKTGIKVDEDGTNRYKCRYHCQCGSKSNVYIRPEREFVTCRDCGEDLFVEAATQTQYSEGIPDRDTFGNFFVAGELSRA